MGVEDLKTCTLCGDPKPRTEFYKRAKSPDGLRPRCKTCQKAKDADFYRRNAEKYIAKADAWRKTNPERYRAYRRDLQARREATDINFKLRRRLRTRLHHALQGGFKAGSAVDLLGCTIDELRLQLEQQFEPGMSWANYGTWHVDHVRPLVDFDLRDPARLATACHHTNLRPLWGTENMSLGGQLRPGPRALAMVG